MMARYVRQILLPEIGEAGQARIARSVAHVGGAGSAQEVAGRYAEAAGFASVEPGVLDVGSLAPASIVKDPAAREVLAGARAALRALRAALQTDVTSS